MTGALDLRVISIQVRSKTVTLDEVDQSSGVQNELGGQGQTPAALETKRLSELTGLSRV